MPSLYELNAEELALRDALECEDYAEDVVEAFFKQNVESKLEACVHVMRNFEAEHLSLKAEADHFAKRAKSAEKAAERLRSHILNYLASTGRVEAKAGLFSLRLRESSFVDVYDEAMVPEEYRRWTWTVDKTSAKEAMDAGTEIPGVQVSRRARVEVK